MSKMARKERQLQEQLFPKESDMVARMAQIKAMMGKVEGKILEAIPFMSAQIQLEVPYSSTVFPPLPTKNLVGTSMRFNT